jgi:hypothetical protein
MICEGCIVQGFYGHQCVRTVVRNWITPTETVERTYTCACAIERGCGSWTGEVT